MRILAIVPFLNEAEFLSTFLESVAAQTRRPDRLVLVDDGSADGSTAIAVGFAASHRFAVAVQRPPRPPRRDRLATADEFKAFLWALESIDEPWDVVAKLDGDLQLNPETIAEIERQFALDDRLGMAGSYLSEEDESGARVRLRIRAVHVHGATKFYRRECWEEIAPVPTLIGWDTMDEVKARMRGWRTQSFSMPGRDPLHLRKRASYDGVARGYRRSGAGAYALGDHPLHVLLYSLRHLRSGAGVAGTLNYLAGWTMAAQRRTRRADPEIRAYVRADQVARIRRRAALLVMALTRSVSARAAG
jgi:glycosyltransferase involved in cell wall biosynthesis